MGRDELTDYLIQVIKREIDKKMNKEGGDKDNYRKEIEKRENFWRGPMTKQSNNQQYLPSAPP